MDAQRDKSPLPQAWIPELDGLRALAALAVVLAHYNPAPFTPPGHPFFALPRVLDFLSLGNLGVVFFYVLSAFLLTYLGVREFDSCGSFDVARFYLRRCFRIWPLYFTILAVDLFLAAPWGPLPPDFAPGTAEWSWIKTHLWMFVGFLSNWSLALNHVGALVDHTPGTLAILWSISVEEQFYLFFPLMLLAALRSPGRTRVIVAVLVSVGILFRLAFLFIPVGSRSIGTSGGMYYATLSYADVFVCGGFAGWVAARSGGGGMPRFAVLRRRGMGTVMLLSFVLLGVIWRGQLWHPAIYSPILYGVTGAIFSLLILWTLAHRGSLVCRILRSVPLRTLGVLSFGMYLWHPISYLAIWYDQSSFVAIAQRGVDVRALGSFFEYLALTVAGAALTYALVERPFLAIKARFFTREGSLLGKAQPTRRPGWVLAFGCVGVLIALMLELAGQAYFGAAARTKFSSVFPLRIDQATVEPTDLDAIYLSADDQMPLALRALAAPRDTFQWTSGSLVLTGAGEMLRVRGDGRAIRLVAKDGRRVRVVNVGMWEVGRGQLGGLDAEYRGGRWVMDTTPMVAANQNHGMQEGSTREPIPGYWISPAEAGYVIRRLVDGAGPYVRVEATRPSSYLVLNGQGILKTLGGVPVALRGQIRAHSAGKATLTLYDVVAADGRAKTYMAQAAATERWTTLVVRADRVAPPDPRDNFSLGIFGAAAGDWFEVRELSLFVGTLP